MADTRIILGSLEAVQAVRMCAVGRAGRGPVGGLYTGFMTSTTKSTSLLTLRVVRGHYKACL